MGSGTEHYNGTARAGRRIGSGSGIGTRVGTRSSIGSNVSLVSAIVLILVLVLAHTLRYCFLSFTLSQLTLLQRSSRSVVKQLYARGHFVL